MSEQLPQYYRNPDHDFPQSKPFVPKKEPKKNVEGIKESRDAFEANLYTEGLQAKADDTFEDEIKKSDPT